MYFSSRRDECMKPLVSSRLTLALVLVLLVATCTTAFAVTQYALKQMEIRQTVTAVASVQVKSPIELPGAFVNVSGSHIVSYGINITTAQPNLKLWINQTETQRASLAQNYTTLVMHVRPHGQTTDILAVDLLTQTSAYTVLMSVDIYQFDLVFDYTPKRESVNIITLDVGVTD